MQCRLQETVAGIKREVAATRAEQVAVRQQAVQLAHMMPVQAGAMRSGINQLLQQQVCAPLARLRWVQARMMLALAERTALRHQPA